MVELTNTINGDMTQSYIVNFLRDKSKSQKSNRILGINLNNVNEGATAMVNPMHRARKKSLTALFFVINGVYFIF